MHRTFGSHCCSTLLTRRFLLGILRIPKVQYTFA
jgi:hypothetical protein